MKHIFLFFSWLTLLTACSPDPTLENFSFDEELNTVLRTAAPNGNSDDFILPASSDLANIPQDPKNPLTPEKITLGKLLFHETGIALAPMQEFSSGTFSCASCHFAGAGFQAGRFQGIGDGGIGFGLNGEGRTKNSLYKGDDLDVQPIRVPTAMNGAFQQNMMWNGQFGATGVNTGTEDSWTVGTPKENNFLGFEGLETQALAGLTEHRMLMDSAFIYGTSYKELFDVAFPSTPVHERYTLLNAALAIAAYERILLANEAPFQRWLRGDRSALNSFEKQGAILFFGKANCVDCHSSPALSSMEFHALGMADLIDCPEETFKTSIDNAQNRGRGGFTNRTEDDYKFKVPQLYNLRDSPFYGHGASFRSVREVVSYIADGVAENPRVPTRQLASQFQPLQLTPTEIDQLTAFLVSGLYDPNLARYEPEQLPTGNCFPNNDPLARSDLGCD